MTPRTCTRCVKVKPETAFNFVRRATGKRHDVCRACHKAAADARRAEAPHLFWAQATISAHRRRGFDVRITVDELVEMARAATRCRLCGVDLDWRYGHKQRRMVPASPSWDRTENGTVLTAENTQVLCVRCNTTKGPRSMKELREWCRAVLEATDDD